MHVYNYVYVVVCTYTAPSPKYDSHTHTHTHTQSGGGYYNVPMPNRDSVVPLPKVGGIVPPQASSLSGLAIDDEDYMNEIPEGVFHTYSNHKELLEQVYIYMYVYYVGEYGHCLFIV